MNKKFVTIPKRMYKMIRLYNMTRDKEIIKKMKIVGENWIIGLCEEELYEELSIFIIFHNIFFII